MNINAMNYKYIVVESSIINYKITLCKKLADFFNCDLILENKKNNHFQDTFNLNYSKNNLALQLKCLLNRCFILDEIKNCKSKLIISDFLMENDKIIAPIILNEDELSLYWKIKQKLMPEFVRPDLLIYLQCSDNTANKKSQDSTNKNYLNKINNEYKNFFHIYDEVPMIIANIDELDLLQNTEHFNLLIKTIYNMHGKKYYLNLIE